MKKINRFLLLSSSALSCCLMASQVTHARTATFLGSNADITNPERGFHVFRELNLTNPSYGSYNTLGSGISLLFLKINADQFRSQPFSTAALNAIRGAFEEAREQGVKVNPRIVYALDGTQADAPLDIVLEHIQQLSPLWHEYKDVINVIDPGFVGAWGEWHASTNNLDSPENRAVIIEALLDAVPEDRMVLIRRPDFKRDYLYGSTSLSNVTYLNDSTAFGGGSAARLGHLNDCFGSSANDVGTYQIYDRQSELDYIGQDAKYLPWGGETCAVSSYNSCENALAELEQLHANYLNSSYNQSVLNIWQSDGCYDEINNRLGYRFSLDSAIISDELAIGALFSVQFSLRNTGFGELFNPRPVQLLFVSGNSSYTIELNEDPRFWAAGETHTVSEQLSLPANMSQGSYDVYLRLPDASSALQNRSEYSIEFANTDIWSEALGANLLFANVTVNDGEGENPTPIQTPEPTVTPATPSTGSSLSTSGGVSTLVIQASFSASSGHQLYIDIDDNPATGFIIDSIGADVLIEGDLMYNFSGITNDVWSWSFAQNIVYASDGNDARFELNYPAVSNVAVFVASLVGTSSFSEPSRVVESVVTPTPTPLVTPAPVGSEVVVHMTKQNAQNFAVDGNNGGANGQDVYLWSRNTNNVNQQWLEIDRGDGYVSYQKVNTNYCLDGNHGGADGQNVYLWTCMAENHNQHWLKVSTGANSFRLEKRNAPNFALDGNNGGANRQSLYLWTIGTNNENQQWLFTSP